jgi:hypothetical protein
MSFIPYCFIKLHLNPRAKGLPVVYKRSTHRSLNMLIIAEDRRGGGSEDRHAGLQRTPGGPEPVDPATVGRPSGSVGNPGQYLR